MGLSKSQLNLLKQQSANIVIFIHGFNVSLGQPGYVLQPEIDGIKMPAFNQLKSSLWVDQTINTIGFGVDKNQLTDLMRVNPSGALSWGMEMEWNLNKAAGHIQTSNFESYQRIVKIIWPSQPKSVLDYMKIVIKAEQFIEPLVFLLQQLVSKKFNVYIVAHSLGNMLLLKALSSLALTGHRRSIKQVFLWQPAIPDNSFDIVDSNELYYCPNAHEAVDRVMVLFSQKDNVLGPSLDGDVDWLEKFEDPNGGLVIASIAKCIDWIDRSRVPIYIGSIYNIANAIFYPLDQLLGSELFRQRYYHQLATDHYHQGVKPTLEAQQDYLLSLMPIVFNGLTVTFIAQIKGCCPALGDLMLYRLSGWLNLPDQFGPIKFNGHSVRYIDDLVANQVATILLTVLTVKSQQTRPAMGWSGPWQQGAVIKRLQREKRLFLVDQSDCLFTHSGIKTPNQRLFETIYQQQIFGGNGMVGW